MAVFEHQAADAQWGQNLHLLLLEEVGDAGFDIVLGEDENVLAAVAEFQLLEEVSDLLGAGLVSFVELRLLSDGKVRAHTLEDVGHDGDGPTGAGRHHAEVKCQAVLDAQFQADLLGGVLFRFAQVGVRDLDDDHSCSHGFLCLDCR